MTRTIRPLNRLALFLPLAICVACNSLERSSDKPNSTTAQREEKSPEMKSILPVPASRPRNGVGGVLIVLDMKNRAGAGIESTDCRWRMLDTATNKSYFVEIPSSAFKKNGTGSFYSTLPSGTYATGRLGCGIKRVWDMDRIYTNGFKVEEGRVSYLGKLTFNFDGPSLREVRKASRADSAQALTSALDRIPPSAGPLVSAFTLKPVTPPMYQTLGEKEGFDIQATGLDNAATVLQPLAESLKACSNLESASDPLRIGHFEYTASYKQGKFVEFIERQDENAFSDTFRACVDQAAARFTASARNQFDVRVKY